MEKGRFGGVRTVCARWWGDRGQVWSMSGFGVGRGIRVRCGWAGWYWALRQKTEHQDPGR